MLVTIAVLCMAVPITVGMGVLATQCINDNEPTLGAIFWAITAGSLAATVLSIISLATG